MARAVSWPLDAVALIAVGVPTIMLTSQALGDETAENGVGLAESLAVGLVPLCIAAFVAGLLFPVRRRGWGIAMIGFACFVAARQWLAMPPESVPPRAQYVAAAFVPPALGAAAYLLVGRRGPSWALVTAILAPVVASLLLAVTGAEQFRAGHGRFASLGFGARLHGILANPNLLGMVSVSAFAVVVLARGIDRFPRLVLASVCGAMIMASGARNAILAVVLGTACWAAVVSRRPGRRSPLAGALMVSAGLFLGLTALSWATGSANTFGSTENLWARLAAWRFGLSLGIDHPLLGVGASEFWQASMDAASRGVFWVPLVHAHNDWIESFAASGFVGLLFLLLCTAALLGSVWSMREWTGIAGAVAAALALTIVMLFEPPLTISQIQPRLISLVVSASGWIALGSALAAGMDGRQRMSPQATLHSDRRTGATSLGLLRRWWWVVAALTAVTAVFAASLALSRSPAYEAKAYVSLANSVADTADGQGVPAPNPAAEVDNSVWLASGPDVAEGAAAILGYVPPAVDVERIGQTTVLSLAVRSSDARDSADAANAYAKAFVDEKYARTQAELKAAKEKADAALLAAREAAAANVGGNPRWTTTSDFLPRDQTYVTSLERLSDGLTLAMALRTGSAQVSTLAVAPMEPVAQYTSLVLIGAVLAGLLMSWGVVVLLNRTLPTGSRAWTTRLRGRPSPLHLASGGEVPMDQADSAGEPRSARVRTTRAASESMAVVE